MNKDRELLKQALEMLEMWREEHEYKSVTALIEEVRAYLGQEETRQ